MHITQYSLPLVTLHSPVIYESRGQKKYPLFGCTLSLAPEKALAPAFRETFSDIQFSDMINAAKEALSGFLKKHYSLRQSGGSLPLEGEPGRHTLHFCCPASDAGKILPLFTKAGMSIRGMNDLTVEKVLEAIPSSPRSFAAKVAETAGLARLSPSVEKLNQTLSELAAKTIYLESRRIRENPTISGFLSSYPADLARLR
jgi:hypothetical protein